MKSKLNYYAVFSKSDNFLHGAFPHTKDGLVSAKKYIKKISNKNNNFYIKKK
jgi:hypothetical protein